MPEHIRSLLVILIVGTLFFKFATKYTVGFVDQNTYYKRKNAWLIITVLAFLSGNFWVFISLLFIYYFAKLKNTTNPAALYLFLILALPTGQIAIPGFGIINYLFEISYQKFLTFLILIPALLTVSSKNKQFKFGKLWSDKFVAAYLIYVAFLYIRDTTPTDMLRQTFYNFIEIFVPYYVISRSIKSLEMLKDALISFIIAISFISVIALFEYLKGWLLYAYVPFVLGISDMTSYLGRAGFVRAIATTGHSIALGYTVGIGIMLFLYFQEYTPIKSLKKSALGILIAGAFSGLSRGPWVGTLFGWVSFTLTDKGAIKKLINFSIIGIVIIGFLSVMPGGEKYVNLIPFIGKTEKENITYREDLFEHSMIVIKRNFWTGSPNFLKTPEMEEMRNGLGVIDIVNSYLGVALASGVIGLILFCGIFTTSILQIYSIIKKKNPDNTELIFIGRALLGAIMSTLMTIATTSSIGIIPIIYWSILGLSAAYINIFNTKITEIKNA